MLQGGGVEDQVRPERLRRRPDAVAVAHVGDHAVDAGRALGSAGVSRTACSAGSEFSRTRRSRRAEGDHAGADLGADRAAAARHEHALAAREALRAGAGRSRPSGAAAGPRSRAARARRLAHALAEARDPRQRQAEAAGVGDQPSGSASGVSALGVATRRRIATPRSREVGDDPLQIVERRRAPARRGSTGQGRPRVATGCRRARCA